MIHRRRLQRKTAAFESWLLAADRIRGRLRYDDERLTLTMVRSNGFSPHVMVSDYEGLPGDGTDLSVEGALNGMIQNMEGSSLQSSRPAKLGGLDGLEGYAIVPVDGVNSDSYTRLVVKGKKMFIVWTIGVDYASFEALANSFQFTQ